MSLVNKLWFERYVPALNERTIFMRNKSRTDRPANLIQNLVENLKKLIKSSCNINRPSKWYFDTQLSEKLPQNCDACHEEEAKSIYSNIQMCM